MAYKAIFSERFNRSFETIIEMYMYLYEYPSSAENINARFSKEVEIIKQFPSMYPIYSFTHADPKHPYRFFMIKKYLIFYSIDYVSQTVTFQDIVHAKNIK